MADPEASYLDQGLRYFLSLCSTNLGCQLHPETGFPLGRRIAASCIWALMLSLSYPERTRESFLEAVPEK